ncbi:PREDICTED: ADP-ribosylation factor-like protein 6-interacting protein 4 [Thamnophis sirtalis]|uniref:ADP-ribosylation factor-like protein 6-interacting protein 4 n=1 Tax=Thamnophis sirtalis TaxID=35019 RepID=A0A6I9YZ38_9SAUR|nr:PREDICTED: ADP-ribosylation factor-like protein 6-interacting protein 4 [Thamnophis sirtalis]
MVRAGQLVSPLPASMHVPAQVFQLKKKKKTKKRRKRKASSSSSETGSSSSSSSSSKSSSSSSASSDESADEKPKPEKKKQRVKKASKGGKGKKRKKRKKKKKKAKRERGKEEGGSKKEETTHGPSLDQWQKEAGSDSGPALTDEQKFRIQAMKPMTKEEWDARQSVIRKVLDPETGRMRLIKGDGEILEEIVTKDRHKEINKQATRGDGLSFQMKMGMLQ